MWPSSVPSGLSAAAHVVALVGALPRELDPRLAVAIRVAAVEVPGHHDETQAAEAVLTELDEAGLDQVNGLLVPVVHLRDTPPASDARTLGHATRLAARRAAADRGPAARQLSGCPFGQRREQATGAGPAVAHAGLRC